MPARQPIILKLILPDATDLVFMRELLIDGAQHGHFSKKIVEEPNYIDNTLASIVKSGRLFDRPLRAQAIIFEHNRQRVGFAVMAEVEANRGGNEIYIFAVDSKLRGQGYGRAMLNEILHRWSLVDVFARCYPASEHMYQMLLKAGFHYLFDMKDGARVLRRLKVGELPIPA
jgi:GNAT superfamily N-acetyltransferase